MELFNTLTGRAEVFEADGDVRMYVCGVTPYDTTHLGHARTYIVFDVLMRHLMYRDNRVRYVQNITDVDDSILQRASEMGESYESLGQHYWSLYLEDTALLGLIPAEAYPPATSAIPQIVQLVTALVESGHAYERDGDVFFRIASFDAYGKLSGLDRAEMIEREREQDLPTVDDTRKEDPLDFLLWSAQRPGEPSWESPWGPGRPGWHIECSTLALTHLGGRIDIHGGGDDLIFPHHENEIAQSEAFTGMRPFARFWVHVAMVRLGGEKMSKSAGNMVFVRDLLKEYPADAIRTYLLQTHYRSPLEFDRSLVDEAWDVARLIGRAAGIPVTKAGGTNPAGSVQQSFDACLDADLDTSGALELLTTFAAGALEDPGSFGYSERKVLRSLAQRLGLQLTERG